jgi:hypothetical protein
MALSRRRTFADRGGTTSARIGAARTRRADLQAASAARTNRLIGATQQFLNPQLSGAQGGFVKGIGDRAGLQGLFGGAVQGATLDARTQFLAGNRLSGLQGIVQDAGQGLNQDQLTAQAGGLQGTLAQILGLNAQFRAGGRAGRESTLALDPGAVGGFIGRRSDSTVGVGRRGLLGERRQQLGTPGTAANTLARQFAESQGIRDTGGFISQNAGGLTRAVTRAGAQGFNAQPGAFARDIFGRGSGPQIVEDSLEGFDAFDDTVRESIFRSNTTPRFGGTAGLAPEGLQGLTAAGLLPFLVQGQGGTQTLSNAFASGSDARDLFSPALF